MLEDLYKCVVTPNVRPIRLGGRPRWTCADGWKARAALKYFYGKERWFGRERYLRAAIDKMAVDEARRTMLWFTDNLPKWRRHVIRYPRKWAWTVILNQPGRHLIIHNFSEPPPHQTMA